MYTLFVSCPLWGSDTYLSHSLRCHSRTQDTFSGSDTSLISGGVRRPRVPSAPCTPSYHLQSNVYIFPPPSVFVAVSSPTPSGVFLPPPVERICSSLLGKFSSLLNGLACLWTGVLFSQLSAFARRLAPQPNRTLDFVGTGPPSK